MWGRFLRHSTAPRARRPGRRLVLEPLEDRCLPATIVVAPATSISTIAQAAAVAKNGDTIQIQAATYTSQEAVFTQNNLTIEGVGGTPIFNDSGYALSNEKGIFDIKGNNVTVIGIEFEYAHDISGSEGDNFAGIRGEGNTLTLQNCSFFHCDDGILINNDANFTTDNNVLMVTGCEFGFNGYGDGFSHNMYIGEITSFTLESSYSHDANQGHLVKSRALTTNLLYDDIEDGTTGGDSSAIDIPYGGNAYLIGNVIVRSASASNHNIITFDDENGPAQYAQQFYAVSNTFVNNFGGGTYVVVSNTPTTVDMTNNIFAGGGTLLSSSVGTPANNLVSNSPGFVNQAGGDYHLAAGSAAIGKAIDPGSSSGGVALKPAFEYVAPLSDTVRYTALDIGAFEFQNNPVSSASTTSLATSNASVQAGTSVTFTATVNSTTAGTITGSVTFKDGTTTLGVGTISGGQATYSTSSLAVNVHSITAVYGGDSNYTGSTSSALSQTITQATSTVSVGASAAVVGAGQAVTFTATVTSSTGIAATGTVTFKEGSATVGTGTLSSGQASFGTSSLTPGSHNIVAVYGGDGNVQGNTSSAVNVLVDSLTVTTPQSLSVNENSSGAGNVLTGASATITAVAGTFATGHGSVTIASDGSYTYTPAVGYAGSDSFSFQAQTAHASASGSVTVTVNHVNVLTVLTPQSLASMKTATAQAMCSPAPPMVKAPPLPRSRRRSSPRTVPRSSPATVRIPTRPLPATMAATVFPSPPRPSMTAAAARSTSPSCRCPCSRPRLPPSSASEGAIYSR
jgi:hypothetical protein